MGVYRKLKKWAVSRLPVLQWAPKYRRGKLVGDLIAGITVALTAIPQSMAYASVAGLSPEFGLYSSFIPCLVYIFLGSCRQMTIGPTAIVELLTFETCGESYASCVILLGFYVGLVQIILALLRLGVLVSLVSEPVTIGFTAGASITIFSSQVTNFLGLRGVEKGDSLFSLWSSIVEKIDTISWGDAILATSCVIFLTVFKIEVANLVVQLSSNFASTLKLKEWIKIAPGDKPYLGKTLWILSISRNALVVIVCTMCAYFWTDRPFAVTGKVKQGFPPVKVPEFSLPVFANSTVDPAEKHSFSETWSDVLKTGPLSVAFISILQNVAIAKAFGSGQSIDATQEMFALGVSHVISSFFSAIPTSGSFTRSAVNDASGVETQFGGIFTALLILFALGVLTPSFYYIPKASLAAIIACAVLSMIEYEKLLPMWKVSRLDFLVCIITFTCSITFGMEYGILLGVAVSIGFYLLKPMRPKMHCELLTRPRNYLLLRPSQGVSFPSVDHIRTIVNKNLTSQNCPTVAFDCLNIFTIDYTGVTALIALQNAVQKTGRNFYFINFKESWHLKFIAAGFVKQDTAFEDEMKFWNFLENRSSSPTEDEKLTP